MTVRTVNNLPAATHGETVRCLFAIELSNQSWVIGFNTPLSEKISRRTLSGYHSVRRVFPDTAGRLACRAAPSHALAGLSLLPAYTGLCLVCVRLSRTSRRHR